MVSSRFSDQHVDVADLRFAWHWMTMIARNDPEGFLQLTGPNLARLRRLYGQPTLKSDGRQGWTVGWSVATAGLLFVVTTGPDSTMFFVRVPTDGEDYLADPRVGVGAVNFLKTLLQQLKAVS